MRRSLLWSAIGLVALSSAAFAEPARVIILRHGGKAKRSRAVRGRCSSARRRWQSSFSAAAPRRPLFRDGDAPAALLGDHPAHDRDDLAGRADLGSAGHGLHLGPGNDEEKEAELDTAHPGSRARRSRQPGLRRQDRDHDLGAQAHREAEAQCEKDEPAELLTSTATAPRPRNGRARMTTSSGSSPRAGQPGDGDSSRHRSPAICRPARTTSGATGAQE